MRSSISISCPNPSSLESKTDVQGLPECVWQFSITALHGFQGDVKLRLNLLAKFPRYDNLANGYALINSPSFSETHSGILNALTTR